MIPGDRLICVFVQDQGAGARFKDWPLHSTIVPWFRSEVSSDSLASEVKASLEGAGAFVAAAGGEAGFGRKGQKQVNLIETSSPLEDIEQKVRRLLHGHGVWIADETTKVRRPFRPHVTVQKSGRVHRGDTWSVKKLYIVLQKGDYKEIVSIIDL